MGEQVPGDEHVVEHLAAALVVQGVSGWGWDGVLDWYQDSTHQVWIAGVFDVAADGHDRDFVRGSVEVAGDDDSGVRVGVEDLIDQPPTSRACDIRFMEDRKEPSAHASADRQV
jgi:hypothetical protein